MLNTENSFRHIIELYVDDKTERNLESIFASLKYIYNGSFSKVYYTASEKMDNIFPFYFVGEKYAVLYNDNNGVISDRYTIGFVDKNDVICETMNRFRDYLIEGRKVYSKETSTKIIEGLIVKLESTNQMFDDAPR